MAAVYRRRQPLTAWNSRWFNQVQIIKYPRLYDLGHKDQLPPPPQKGVSGKTYQGNINRGLAKLRS